MNGHDNAPDARAQLVDFILSIQETAFKDGRKEERRLTANVLEGYCNALRGI